MNKKRQMALAAIFFVFSVLVATVGIGADAVKSRVVLARNPAAIDDRGQVNGSEVTRLFDRALLALTGQATAADAWKALGLRPEDTLAVKINCNTWTVDLSPDPQLIDALCRSLRAVLSANRIIIYDNESSALVERGFAINRSASGVRRTGTDQGDGFDEKERLTRIVTHTATKIINLASLKCVDGDMAVSLLLKNHIGSLVPADMPKCHDDADFLAGVCARPSIKNKTILNLVTGLRGTYRRGVPWYWAGLIFGTDPLAVESAAIGVMNEKRGIEKVALLPLPASLKIAEKKYGLGTIDTAKIEQIKIDL